jgi:hypothetical protein
MGTQGRSARRPVACHQRNSLAFAVPQAYNSGCHSPQSTQHLRRRVWGPFMRRCVAYVSLVFCVSMGNAFVANAQPPDTGVGWGGSNAPTHQGAVTSGVHPAVNGPVRICDATAVRLSLTDSLSSATNHEDDPVYFEVRDDVKFDNVVAIARGATGVGHVVEVEPKKRLGRAGKLNFALDYVKAVDNSNVRLRASSTRKGDDKTGTVIVGTVLLSPLFLIMRGKDVSIPRGMEVTAYVDGDSACPARVQTEVSSLAAISIHSTPDGADIVVDGKYAGSTPSTLQLAAGDHNILVEMAAFSSWQRTVTVAGASNVTINAVLEKKPN